MNTEKTTQLIEVKLREAPKGWDDQIKVGADIIGPFIAAFFGLLILRLTKRIEKSQWKDQKLIEKRLLIWDELGPSVNDIYCYCMRIGQWKEFTPPDIIRRKRVADKKVHLSRPYFSNEFFNAYIHFTRNSFAMFHERGVDAKIKSNLFEHQTANTNWDNNWDHLFCDAQFNSNALDQSYELLLHCMHKELS